MCSREREIVIMDFDFGTKEKGKAERERESLVEWNTTKCGVTNFEFITKITLFLFLLKLKMYKCCFHFFYSNSHFLDPENEY